MIDEYVRTDRKLGCIYVLSRRLIQYVCIYVDLFDSSPTVEREGFILLLELSPSKTMDNYIGQVCNFCPYLCVMCERR